MSHAREAKASEGPQSGATRGESHETDAPGLTSRSRRKEAEVILEKRAS